MKNIEKKLRKNEFLPHPELSMHDWVGLWGLVAKIHVPFYIFMALYQDYFSFLASLDLVIVSLMLIFIFTLKPLMMRGFLNGFYRKHYQGVKSMIWSFIIMGSTIRTVLLGLYYIFVFSWVSGDETHHRYLIYMKAFKENYSSITGIVLGIVICGYLFYSLFYKDRFISIREFSMKVAQNMKHGSNYKDACYRVLNEKSYVLENNTQQHVKYEKNNSVGDIFNVFTNNNVQPNSSSVSQANKLKRSLFSPMRRQSRK